MNTKHGVPICMKKLCWMFITVNIQSKNPLMTGYVRLKVCIRDYINHDLCGQLTVLVCFSSKFVNLCV